VKEALLEILGCDGIGRPGRAHEWRDGWCAACGKKAETMLDAALALLLKPPE
jgi:hypothetical protein